MKLAFLTSRADRPSTRFRVSVYFSFFKNMGHEPELIIFPSGFFPKFSFFKRLKGYDFVIIQRKLLNFIDFYLIKKYVRKIVFDFDDAVMFRDSAANVRLCGKRLRLFERMTKNSLFVIAGNKYLSEWAAKYNSNTFILPTPVDTVRFSQKTHSYKNDTKIIIGWIGSSSTLKYLENLIPFISKLSEKYPDICLKIISNTFFSTSGIKVIKKIWSEAEEIEDIKSFDIGLMPLTDDPWARGKCGFKLLQYMSCGLPAIASPVGVNSEIVNDGINGFLASSEDEWISKLSLLIENSQLRQDIGLKARETIEQKYSLQITGKKFAVLLDKFSRQ